MSRRRKPAVGAQRLRCDFEALRRYIHIGIHLELTPEAPFVSRAEWSVPRREMPRLATRGGIVSSVFLGVKRSIIGAGLPFMFQFPVL
ncbi:hypothetical protein JCM17478_33110 [Thermopirellula anaerolimosa]